MLQSFGDGMSEYCDIITKKYLITHEIFYYLPYMVMRIALYGIMEDRVK